MGLTSAIEKAWYRRSPGWLWLLLPLEGVFRVLSALRRRSVRPVSAEVPVVVVGNLAVGGSGKTPLVLALTEALTARGYRVGICSRGYGSRAPSYPYFVTNTSLAVEAGDEPLLLARRSGVPVVIAPDRPLAVSYLRDQCQCNVILSDDGLQHYKMARKVEVVVIDGTRNLGNGHCLPVGPLREPPSRLGEVDFVVVNNPGQGSPVGEKMHLKPMPLQPLNGGAADSDSSVWRDDVRRVHAVAGIGNPARFFSTLRQMGLELVEHPFADHHKFTRDDFQFAADLPIVMTEKDAVKCGHLGLTNAWYVPVTAELPADFLDRVIAAIEH
ncbi:tetraacyldisaccharide 4'-kinase [Spongiibacter taiwanensis]|uniref:tetraacyldisaccharide 4'-kinase n=1 Tax=Spongiibacter taiwanensis TaxID=1748242 RepID=UPI002034B85B|nr:tetraacyldisaccharide 4'-kinase [Spongiibacter taiwanensis]USA43512.1 tetraacyldisaccharide 4'-kinase [Spongiibacter taiwanensis]